MESLENGSPWAGKRLQDSSPVVQGRNIATDLESSGSFLVRELESGGAAHGMCLVSLGLTVVELVILDNILWD